jgi:peptidoglycan-associated lipoprotein
MQKNRVARLLLLIIIVVSFLFVACTGKNVAPEPQETPEAAVSEPQPQPPPEEYQPEPIDNQFPDGWETFVNEDIYFNKNSSVLLPEAKEVLNRKAAWLHEHPDVRIVIQGHSDEKGSAEYNMALADHRAGNAKSYLLGHGIATERLAVVSYGSESPATVSQGEFDSGKNRRVHFSLDVID